MMNKSIGIGVIAVIVAIAAILAIVAVASSITVHKASAITDPNQRSAKSFLPGLIHGITDPDIRSVK